MRLRTTRAIVVLLALVLVSCSGSSEGGDDESTGDVTTGEIATAPGVESAEAALDADRVVIDVRTPEEFDASHVEGAALYDVQDPGFDAAIEELDPAVDYVVYCRSGNRSAVAAERMRAVDLDVLDGGGLDDMIDAGWPASS